MTVAVLLMAYGSPTRTEDLVPYLQGIYGGKPVPPSAVEEHRKKYKLVTGVSPSNLILETLVSKLDEILESEGDFKVYLGNKHWHPSMDNAISRISEDGCDEIIAVPLFPFRSHNIERSYREPLLESLKKQGKNFKIKFINGFEGEGLFYATWIGILSEEVINQVPETLFVFSAHSLPVFSQDEDEYVNSFMNASRKLADILKITNFTAVFQSQGKHGTKWLGPGINSVMDNPNERIKRITAVPLGFLYDHLEITYDLDAEFGEKVRIMGMEYRRTNLPNFSPTFLLALRNIILDNFSCKS